MSSSDDRPGPGICGSKYVEDEKAARSVRVWDRVPIKNKAEGLVLAGASCCRTCHLCVAFHRRSGFPCPPTPARHLMTCLNPPNPLFKGAHQGLRAFHRRSGFPCPPTPARHLMSCLNPPNPLFKGAHQDLRAFHRRKGRPARQLRPGI